MQACLRPSFRSLHTPHAVLNVLSAFEYDECYPVALICLHVKTLTLITKLGNTRREQLVTCARLVGFILDLTCVEQVLHISQHGSEFEQAAKD